jgi:hypothetical protein
MLDDTEAGEQRQLQTGESYEQQVQLGQPRRTHLKD